MLPKARSIKRSGLKKENYHKFGLYVEWRLEYWNDEGNIRFVIIFLFFLNLDYIWNGGWSTGMMSKYKICDDFFFVFLMSGFCGLHRRNV